MSSSMRPYEGQEHGDPAFERKGSPALGRARRLLYTFAMDFPLLIWDAWKDLYCNYTQKGLFSLHTNGLFLKSSTAPSQIKKHH